MRGTRLPPLEHTPGTHPASVEGVPHMAAHASPAIMGAGLPAAQRASNPWTMRSPPSPVDTVGSSVVDDLLIRYAGSSVATTSST